MEKQRKAKKFNDIIRDPKFHLIFVLLAGLLAIFVVGLIKEPRGIDRKRIADWWYYDYLPFIKTHLLVTSLFFFLWSKLSLKILKIKEVSNWKVLVLVLIFSFYVGLFSPFILSFSRDLGLSFEQLSLLKTLLLYTLLNTPFLALISFLFPKYYFLLPRRKSWRLFLFLFVGGCGIYLLDNFLTIMGLILMMLLH